MKKLLISSIAVLCLGAVASADIQAPPGHAFNSTRKFSRGLANVLYGFIEIPEQIVRKNKQYGGKTGWSYGAVDGTRRAFKRLGLGFYEMVTFHCPTYKGTFKPPYETCGQDGRIEMNVHDGLSEFPPELGFESYFNHSRRQSF